MYFPLAAILLYFCLSCVDCGTRIYYRKCNMNGFTCITVNGKTHLTYTCQSSIKDTTIYLNAFTAPGVLGEFNIRNCPSLEVSFICAEAKLIEKLTISNVANLKFIDVNYDTQSPTVVILENIQNIEIIPPYTFSNLGDINARKCKRMTFLKELHFTNVTINTIETFAFTRLKTLNSFTWKDVNTSVIQHSAIDVSVEKKGEFAVRNSNLQYLDHLAFKITSPKVEFSQNKFVDISPSGINGTMETFNFSRNFVDNVESHSFSLLSQNVHIRNNRFLYLKAGALEKISPGLMQDSNMNFAKLEFLYDFSNNEINFIDAPGLHPDIAAYDNVASKVKFTRNTMLCSCENLGWLFSGVGHGYNTEILRSFYEIVLNHEYENKCSTTCRSPISIVKKLIQNNNCSANIDAEKLCVVRTSTSTETNNSSSSSSTVGAYFNAEELITGEAVKNIFQVVYLSVFIFLFYFR